MFEGNGGARNPPDLHGHEGEAAIDAAVGEPRRQFLGLLLKLCNGHVHVHHFVRLVDCPVTFDRFADTVGVAPTVYVMCGLPFAGKSTLAALLAERLSVPVVRLDAINHERGLGLDGAAIPGDEFQRTYAEADRRIHLALQAGQSVIFDHASPTRAERDGVRAIAEAQGAGTRVIYLPIDVTEARRRLVDNRRTGRRYDVRDEDFELVVAAFEPPTTEADTVVFDPAVPLEDRVLQAGLFSPAPPRSCERRTVPGLPARSSPGDDRPLEA